MVQWVNKECLQTALRNQFFSYNKDGPMIELMELENFEDE